MHLYFIPVYEWITPQFAAIPHFVFPFHWRTFRLFPHFSCNESHCHSHLSIHFCAEICFLLGVYVGVDFLSLCQTLRNCQICSKMAVQFYISTSSVWGFQLLQPPTSTCGIFDDRHLSECEVISHWFASSWWRLTLNHLSCAVSHLYILFWEMSIEICCPF